jgi:hypothetical protein
MSAAAAAAAQSAAFAQQQQHHQQQWLEQQQMEQCRADVLAAHIAETAAAEIVELVVRQSTDVMIGNHLDRLAIPYTVRCVIKEALDFVQCAFVGQDSGCVTETHWHVDPLAPRVVVDPWARAAIAVQQQYNSGPVVSTSMSELESTPLGQPSLLQRRVAPKRTPGKLHPGGGSTPSQSPAGVSSPTSALSPDSNAPKTVGGKKALAPVAKGSTASHRDGTRRTKADGSAGAGGGSADSSGSGLPPSGTPMSLEEQDFVERTRAEQRRKAEARALHDKLSKGMEELKKAEGNFTVDSTTGKVIAIVPFDANAGARRVGTDSRFAIGGPAPPELAPVKAPANRRAAGGGPSSAPAAAASSSMMSASGGGSPASASLGGGGRSASTRQRKPEATEFYHEEASYGPMIEAVPPSGGVTVKDRDLVAKGGEVKMPKSKMSRGEFQKLASIQAMNPMDDGFFDKVGSSPSQPGLSQPAASFVQQRSSGHQQQQPCPGSPPAPPRRRRVSCSVVTSKRRASQRSR